MNPNDPQFGPLPVPPRENPLPAPTVGGTYPAVEQPQPMLQTQPDAQTAALPPVEQKQYDFILNPAPAPKKLFLFSGGSPLKLLAIVGGAALIIIILGVLLTSFLTKSGTAPILTTVVQEQQELIRIATLAESQSTSESIRGLAYNVDLSISTSKSQLTAYLTKRGTELNEKQLALKHDTATDQLLTNAKATSTYDRALQKVLAAQLQTYLADVKKAYSQTSSKTLRSLLNSSFEAGKTLLAQAQSSTTDNTQ